MNHAADGAIGYSRKKKRKKKLQASVAVQPPSVRGAMGCSQNSFKLVWSCTNACSWGHGLLPQLQASVALSGFLAKDHIKI